MNYINYILNSIFGVIFYPFNSLDPIYGLIAVSLLTALIVLPIFKYASDQEGIKRAKSRIMGYLLEVRLFKDDIRTVLLAQKNILKYNMIYLRYTLKPLLFMVIPIVIIIIQTGLRYEYRPLRVGESTLVKVKLNSVKGDDAVLIVPVGLKVETPPLRIDGGKEIYWRIGVEDEGKYDLVVKVHDEEAKKKIFATDKVSRLSPKVSKGGFFNSLFQPSEFSLPEDSVLESFEIRYPHRKVVIFGWDIHWLVLFFILSLALSFLLVKPFKVRI